MRQATNRRSILRALAAGSLVTGIPGVGHARQEDGSNGGGFDPNVHGFGFPNWSTAVPTFPDHDHDGISETQIQRTIRRKWRDPMERLLEVDLGSAPDVLVDAIAKQVYVSVNQLSGTNGHCYGMVFAAQQYFERPETLPLDVASASDIRNPAEPLDDWADPVGEEIDLFHITQYLDPNAWIGRRQINWPSTINYQRQLADLLSVVEEYGSAGITIFEAGARQSHQVLVYDAQDIDDGVRLLVYDPNRRAGRYGGKAEVPHVDVVPDAETPVSYSLNPVYEHFVYNRRDRIVAGRAAAASTASESQLPSFGDNLLRVGLFLLESDHACLNVVDPDGKRVGRDTATFQDREHTTYDAMRYRYGVDPGRYRLAITARRGTDYTLSVQAAAPGGELVHESATESIAAGETHEYAATIPSSAEQDGSLERVGTGIPRWLLAVGGVGAAGVGAAAYRQLGSKSGDDGEM